VLSLQAVILLAFVAESGVHSVHHLTDPNGATACQVLSVSQQVTGDLPTSALVPREPAVAGLLVVPTTPPIPADAPQRPDRGRAPPVPA
jgi:hypothetical protein